MINQTVGGSEPKTPHTVARAMAALAANASPLTTLATEPATRPKVAPAVPLHPEPSATISIPSVNQPPPKEPSHERDGPADDEK